MNIAQTEFDSFPQPSGTPKVSVAMITYNHERYIAQAIESVLMQQANFEYELVIGEDCSQDNTLEIIESYQARYPDKIRLLTTEKNLGPNRNLVRTYQACQGEYVALLEGDDYWISPHKLHKQVDFLDVHPNFAICFHNALIVDEERHQEPRPFRRGDQKEISTLRDLISGNFIPTCSTVFRNKLIQEFPEWFYRLKMADRPLHILNAEHGDIYYLNEIMSVYRKHPEGIWTKSDYADQIVSRIPLYMEVNPYLDYKFDDVIKSKLKELWERLAIVIIEREVQLGRDRIITRDVLDKEILNTLTERIRPSDQWKSSVFEKIYERLLFDRYEAKDFVKARYYYKQLIRQQPSKLKNRGLYFIGLEILLGQSVMSWIRRSARKVHISKKVT